MSRLINVLLKISFKLFEKIVYHHRDSAFGSEGESFFPTIPTEQQVNGCVFIKNKFVYSFCKKNSFQTLLYKKYLYEILQLKGVINNKLFFNLIIYIYIFI